MIKKTCPNPDCQSIVVLDETNYSQGEVVKRECQLCGQEIEFIIPEPEPEEEEEVAEEALPAVATKKAVARKNGKAIRVTEAGVDDGQASDEEFQRMREDLEVLKAHAVYQEQVNHHLRSENEKMQRNINEGARRQQQQAAWQPPVSGKNKNVAGILAILFGNFGIHKFYLNKPGMGILYLLFCWTYIPAFIGFIEGIMYLCADENEFKAKHP